MNDTSVANESQFKLTSILPWIGLLISLVVFFNSLNNGFVDYGDPANFLNNDDVTRKSFFEALVDIFTSTVNGQYHPISTLSYWVDNSLFGINNPRGWHGINVLLHIVSVFLVYKVTIRLGFSARVAFVVSVLFGIHPMHVESVAWISQRKDVLCGVFYYATLLSHLKSKTSSGFKWKGISLLFFLLALLSNVAAISIPLVLVAIDYYKSGKSTWTNLRSNSPYFLLAIVVIGLNIIFGANTGNLYGDYGIIDHWALASFAIVTYLYKLVLPLNLSGWYEFPDMVSGIHYASMLIIPVLCGLLWWLYRVEKKVAFFGLCFFLANVLFHTLLPVSIDGYMADHYSYISYYGLFLIVAYYALNSFGSRSRSNIMYGLLGLIALYFSYNSIQQNKTWADGETFWSQAIKVNPASSDVYGMRGDYYLSKNDINKALSDYNTGLSIEENGDLYGQRAIVYLNQILSQEVVDLAIQDLNKAITLNPDKGIYYRTRARAYKNKGFINRVLKDLNSAVRLDPNDSENYFERARNFGEQGDNSASLRDINKAVTMQPWNCSYLKLRIEIHKNMGNLKLYDQDINTLNRIGC